MVAEHNDLLRLSFLLNPHVVGTPHVEAPNILPLF